MISPSLIWWGIFLWADTTSDADFNTPTNEGFMISTTSMCIRGVSTYAHIIQKGSVIP